MHTCWIDANEVGVSILEKLLNALTEKSLDGILKIIYESGAKSILVCLSSFWLRTGRLIFNKSPLDIQTCRFEVVYQNFCGLSGDTIHD